jgi:hypothetical protein
MHEILMPETPKRKVKLVGPYDIVGSEVDLLKDTCVTTLVGDNFAMGPR